MCLIHVHVSTDSGNSSQNSALEMQKNSIQRPAVPPGKWSEELSSQGQWKKMPADASPFLGPALGLVHPKH